MTCLSRFSDVLVGLRDRSGDRREPRIQVRLVLRRAIGFERLGRVSKRGNPVESMRSDCVCVDVDLRIDSFQCRLIVALEMHEQVERSSSRLRRLLRSQNYLVCRGRGEGWLRRNLAALERDRRRD